MTIDTKHKLYLTVVNIVNIEYALVALRSLLNSTEGGYTPQQGLAGAKNFYFKRFIENILS